ncbi:DUF2460 domain-containing protein [Acidihalobacter prosperus]|uniref:DUF2460 domain-containing protein n=1 Tax=Acidihalobacter prosperus TaxID=160660 RepID=A0A1A6C898_9GAMM|nr:DUF2460 domain-containing protein [Acidihalobacter prosperus]OBS10781.1 hypothetical protein Thpro_020497 [Acidihalobacter prosperus]
MSGAPFAEILLDLGYDYATVGGPQYDTIITATASGREYRTRRWSASRGKWQIGQRRINRAEIGYLLAFFRARSGQYEGFRFLDWQDYSAAGEALTLTGAPTAQLVKTYQDSAGSYQRTISKPNAGATLTRAGSAYAYSALDTTTGILTFSADHHEIAASATPGATTVVNVASAAVYTVNNLVWISNLTGYAAQAVKITARDTTANAITLALDTSASGSLNAPTLDLYPQPGEAILWSGSFHVPARFDTDQFSATFAVADPDTGDALFDLASLTVVEIRL